ncbi:hypothetical protein [Sphingobium sp. CFD-2]|uniref:hypothetical protein n=1 Tax=Sphingobium sp. CFD-2 TaxID=2878542 RepID=UPI00214C16AD|nr:hypothetical protein [Sphingobium sp. CFD-2]
MLLGLAALIACDARDNRIAPSDNGPGHEDEASSLLSDERAPAAPDAPATGDIAMPAFAPQYPGSTITAVNSSAAGRNLHEVRLETQDDAARIMDFYRDKFSAGGLRKTSDFQSGGTGVLSAAAKNRKASIAIVKEGTKNSIVLTYSGD